MKKVTRLALVFMSSALFYSSAYATSIPNTDDPKTFLGPTLRVGYTSTINDYSAFSLAGEAGLKNFRVGATLGWKLTDYQRFKLSAEYLWQDITYAFFSGNTDRWMNQGAIGAAYQYDIADNGFRPQFDISAYGSHAPSKTLSTVTGTFTNQGIPTKFIDMRRIAGSDGAGAATGLAIMPWNGGRFSIAANYDSVRYDKDFSPGEDAIGLGGTAGFNQVLVDNVSLGLTAAVRKPFNNYAANLAWSNIPYYGSWTLALFGDYNVGKNTLPDTYNVGLGADYFLDMRCSETPPSLKGETAQPVSDNLLAWTADPAVYMPQVLAVVDERVDLTCVAPVTYIGPANPGALLPTSGGAFDFNFAPFFTGTPITFGISVITPNGSGDGNPSDFSINPTTGVVSYTGTGGTYIVTVTGTNSCGSASVTFNFEND